MAIYKTIFKKFTSYLPILWQKEIKRYYYQYQIRKNRFLTEEPEFLIIENFVSQGDWIIDIGANIGHYTKRFSELVGQKGRVIAVEPVPETFSLLANNTTFFKHSNITLVNMAASDQAGIVGMKVPHIQCNKKNYYEARITEEKESEFFVMKIALESLMISHTIKLIKIDVEGHDYEVLNGLEKILVNDHPILIVETSSNLIYEMLQKIGYNYQRLPCSPNTIFYWGKKVLLELD